MTKTRIAAIVLAAAVAGAGVLAFTGVPAGLLADALKGRIEQETGYRLRIAGSARIGLWPIPTVSFSDIGVLDPRTSDHDELFAAQNIAVGFSLQPLLRGRIEITEITVTQPVVRISLSRDRNADRGRSGGSDTTALPAQVDVHRITVKDGAIILNDARTRTDTRVDGIQIDAHLPRTGKRLSIEAEGRVGDQILRLKATSQASASRGLAAYPIELTFEAPGILSDTLTASTTITSVDKLLKAEGLSGRIGAHAFAGAISADFSAAKPSINAEFGFHKLELLAPSARAPGAPATTNAQPATVKVWSDESIDLDELNFFDAVVRANISGLSIGKLRLAPVSVDATIANGVLDLALSKTGLYDGRVQGRVTVDASGPALTHALRFDLEGVRAYPLLSDAADFDHIDGRMRARLDLRATGNSPHTFVSTLSGNADVSLQDGEVRSINIAQMVRTLMAQVLSGWQDGEQKKTDFNQLSATFRLENGQATTTDLSLAGPLVRLRGAGTADLLTRQLSFRIDPKVVATLEGQGGPTDPLGLGVPVIVRGDWDAPEIYPDIAGITDNPQAAFDTLKKLGQGLFGVISGDPESGTGTSDFGKTVTDLFGSKSDGKGDSKHGASTGPDQKTDISDLPGAALDLLRGLFGK
jgi:AsmA protein